MLKKWQSEGVINATQAQRMRKDVDAHKREKGSDKLITAISTIGSLLLGIGAILFIASNWSQLHRIVKVIILLASTFGSYGAGYFFAYSRANLPRVGKSLLFLGALLFGATLILIAQIYNLNANTHILVLLWLIGIIPISYTLRSKPLAVLSTVLFFIWILEFISVGNEWWSFFELGRGLFPILMLTATCLFAFGGLHHALSTRKRDLHTIGGIYRISALQVLFINLLFLTFEVFSRGDELGFRSSESSPWHLVWIIGLAVLSVGFMIFNWFSPSKEGLSFIELPAGLVLVGLSLLFYFYPSESYLYPVVFNLVMPALAILVLVGGYIHHEMRLVNLGMFWLSVFIFFKYFDWFWELLSRSAFFIVGGALLVAGSIALERKRRQIKKEIVR